MDDDEHRYTLPSPSGSAATRLFTSSPGPDSAGKFQSRGTTPKLGFQLPSLTRTSTQNSIKAPTRRQNLRNFLKRISRTLSGNSPGSAKVPAELHNGRVPSPSSSGYSPVKISLQGRRQSSIPTNAPPPPYSPSTVSSGARSGNQQPPDLHSPALMSHGKHKLGSFLTITPPLSELSEKNNERGSVSSRSDSSQAHPWDASKLPPPPTSPSNDGAYKVEKRAMHAEGSVSSAHDSNANGHEHDKGDSWNGPKFSEASPSEHQRTSQRESRSFQGIISELEDTSSFSASSSSTNDRYVYRNDRQFPPRLPAHQSGQAITLQSRRIATQFISSWVSDFERSQGASRRRMSKHDLARRHQGSRSSSMPRSQSTHSGELPSPIDPGSMLLPDQEEVEKLWQQLKKGRTEARETKLELREKREELGVLRQKLGRTDKAFMNIVQPMIIQQGIRSGAALEDLKRLLDDMVATRNQYNQVEAEYAGAEEALERDEDNLDIIETRFFDLLAAKELGDSGRDAQHVNQGVAGPGIADPNGMPFDLRGISPDGPGETVHPLYTQLVDAVGEYQIAKEEYGNMLLAGEQAKNDLESIRRTGRKLPTYLKTFLEEFPAERDLHTETFEKCQKEVARLKALCEETGAISDNLSLEMRYLLYPDKDLEDLDLEPREIILQGSQTLAHHLFPSLLSQPDHIFQELSSTAALRKAVQMPKSLPVRSEQLRLASKEFAIEKLIVEPVNEGNFDLVNQWLLFNLRTAPLNAILLCTTFEGVFKLKIRNPLRWQNDVLYYWWKDGTHPRVVEDEMPQRVKSPTDAESEAELTTEHNTENLNSTNTMRSVDPEHLTGSISTRRLTKATTFDSQTSTETPDSPD